MNKIRQILRLHFQGQSKLQIAAQTGVARNTLKKYIADFSQCGLSFSEISELSDKDLEELFVKKDPPPLSEKLQFLFDLSYFYAPVFDFYLLLSSLYL